MQKLNWAKAGLLLCLFAAPAAADAPKHTAKKPAATKASQASESESTAASDQPAGEVAANDESKDAPAGDTKPPAAAAAAKIAAAKPEPVAKPTRSITTLHTRRRSCSRSRAGPERAPA